MLLLVLSAVKCCRAIASINQWCLLPALAPQSHDVGFIIMTSFGDALEALLEPAAPAAGAGAGWYRGVVLNAAASLAQRWVACRRLERCVGARCFCWLPAGVQTSAQLKSALPRPPKDRVQV